MSSPPPSTRSRILDAALALVERGAPLTMGAIASEAGLSRQALYLLFADKTDLFVALLRYADGKRGIVAQQAKVRAAESGAEALAAIVDFHARLNPGYKPLADAFELLRRQDSAAQQAWEDRQRDRLEGCRAVVARLVAEGVLRPGLDPAQAADLLWTMTSTTHWDDLVHKRGWSAESYREQLVELLLSWLTASR